jgi:hypothetical protein
MNVGLITELWIFDIQDLSTGSEFDPQIGGPRMNINMTFDIKPVYITKEGIAVRFSYKRS